MKVFLRHPLHGFRLLAMATLLFALASQLSAQTQTTIPPQPAAQDQSHSQAPATGPCDWTNRRSWLSCATKPLSDPAAIQLASSACGPYNIKFDVQRVPRSAANLTPPAGQALIIVEGAGMPAPIMRIGIDGKWMGATKPASYLAIPVLPGVHHLCLQSQPGRIFHNHGMYLNQVNVVSGNSYYFLVDVFQRIDMQPALEAIDSDEGRDLVLWSAAAESTVRQVKNNGANPTATAK